MVAQTFRPGLVVVRVAGGIRAGIEVIGRFRSCLGWGSEDDGGTWRIWQTEHSR